MVQCGAVWCSVVQWCAVWCSGVQCVAVCCSVVQWCTVCCSVLHVCDMTQPHGLQHLQHTATHLQRRSLSATTRRGCATTNALQRTCTTPAPHLHHTCTTPATQAVFGNDEAGVRNPVGGELSQKSALKSFTHSSLSQCVKNVCCRFVAGMLQVCCRCIYTLVSFRVCQTLGSKNGVGMHIERDAPI